MVAFSSNTNLHSLPWHNFLFQPFAARKLPIAHYENTIVLEQRVNFVQNSNAQIETRDVMQHCKRDNDIEWGKFTQRSVPLWRGDFYITKFGANVIELAEARFCARKQFNR